MSSQHRLSYFLGKVFELCCDIAFENLAYFEHDCRQYYGYPFYRSHHGCEV